MSVMPGLYISKLWIRKIEGKNSMLELYQKIEEMDQDSLNIILTVIEGSSIGEKALLCDCKLVYESVSGGFFTVYKDEIEKIDTAGIFAAGGQRVFAEFLCREKRMVICGGGHVSIPIIKMGLMTGFHVTVLEDRPMFADNARRAGASEVFCEPFEDGLEKIEGDEDTYFVIVTRGHRYDQTCMERIVRKRHAYIGMIGSRKRSAMVKEMVIEGGADPEIVGSVYSPIGLHIGAETPEEIAVSIMAEIIQVKSQKRRSSGYSGELMDALLGRMAVAGKQTRNEKSDDRDIRNVQERRVLATIIARRGSAPREAGTKMLILPDGKCVGTIGGGCAEAEILRKALWMLRSDENSPRMCYVDMTGRDAEEEGMVCGGVIDVLLEVV